MQCLKWSKKEAGCLTQSEVKYRRCLGDGHGEGCPPKECLVSDSVNKALNKCQINWCKISHSQHVTFFFIAALTKPVKYRVLSCVAKLHPATFPAWCIHQLLAFFNWLDATSSSWCISKVVFHHLRWQCRQQISVTKCKLAELQIIWPDVCGNWLNINHIAEILVAVIRLQPTRTRSQPKYIFLVRRTKR